MHKVRGFTQVQLAEAADATQRAISYFETQAGFPPAPPVIVLAKALQITTHQLLGMKPPKVERMEEDSEALPDCGSGFRCSQDFLSTTRRPSFA